VRVQDTGQGITPDFLPHVFEYFRQADSTTTRQFGGLGLGLAIVRYLTELHGGIVWAESLGDGQGATFTVRFPLMMDEEETDFDGELILDVIDLTGIKILAIDDEADMRELVAFSLEEAGACVQLAASAQEALLLLNESLPDVIICDIGMPEVNGYMLMTEIRSKPLEKGGKIPAIALTAYAGETNHKKALTAGFQMHLSKPVEPDKLVETIAKLLKQSQLSIRNNSNFDNNSSHIP
jgi:CheY-like chemotaxis protein